MASRPAFLYASPNDAFVQGSVVSSSGVFYVPYERTYAGLPVVGGDFVVVIDGAGQVIYNSVALKHPSDIPSITPTLTRAAAETIATRQLRSVARVEGTQLVVSALGATARLAWESIVDGVGANGISRLTVDVDAVTGTVLRQQEHVLHGSGTAAWNGPNPVALGTTQSGNTFLMQDPTITNLSCQDAANNTIFSGPDDAWGNGDATVRETGCVDALFGAQTEARMLSQWLGRNAMDGAGGAWPIRVGLADLNAFYDGTQVQIGHNTANQWIGSIDVIAHEMGHGIDHHTPGGISGNGTQEFIADTFGASTEWFANEPAPFDVPDFTVGEQINLLGTGAIRNMSNPSALGDPNCYSSSIPSTEVHSAAGPGNHWFYLLAEGSNPANGQPASPTCNGSTVVGLGVQSAITILYHAMLMKTTASSYLKYRTWTLQAAKNVFPGSCKQFNTVKAAWDAVSVPAQLDEPTCATWPQVMVNENGVVHQIYGDTSGWHDGNTGLAIPADSAISAVNMSDTWPQVMVNENGVLHLIYGDSSGWHDGNTGLAIPTGSAISAVNMGGTWPQVMVNENGVLHLIYGDTSGWHDGNTGLAIPAGSAISAVDMGGAWPQVMVSENGVVHQIYGDTSGWHDGNTGLAIPAGSAISAVNMATPQAGMTATLGLPSPPAVPFPR